MTSRRQRRIDTFRYLAVMHPTLTNAEVAALAAVFGKMKRKVGKGPSQKGVKPPSVPVPPGASHRTGQEPTEVY